MNQSLQAFKAALNERRAVKIIAGIANLDVAHVLDVVAAADAAGAHAVDVAATADVVRAVRAVTDTVVFASGVEPSALAEAVDNGADVVELGNFDALYEAGLFLDAGAVLKRAEETVQLVAGRALVSITVPGHLNIDAQVALARQLESLGVDLIQSEGSARVLSVEPTVKRLDAVEKFALTLRNAETLAYAVHVPVMVASGITANNAARALQTGAAAIGVGTFVNGLKNADDMASCAQSVMQAVSLAGVEAAREVS